MGRIWDVLSCTNETESICLYRLHDIQVFEITNFLLEIKGLGLDHLHTLLLSQLYKPWKLLLISGAFCFLPAGR